MIDPDHPRRKRGRLLHGGRHGQLRLAKARIDEAQSQGLWTIVGMHKNCITTGEKSCEIGAPLFNVLVGAKST